MDFADKIHIIRAGVPAQLVGELSSALNRYLVRIDVPEAVWAMRRCFPPAGWDALPAGMVGVQAGEAWLLSKASALLRVPSAVVPEETNEPINPQHPHAARFVTAALRKWHYDPHYF